LNPSIRRPLAAALLGGLFLLALGVSFAASSAGEEEKPVKRVGAEAVPLDVPAAGAESPGLAEADALPDMARKPEPAPKPADEPEPEPEVETFTEDPVAPEPVAPPEPAPAPAPAPAPEPPPPVEFDDEG
jgi:outer membrane biosynthesis protein TonB